MRVTVYGKAGAICQQTLTRQHLPGEYRMLTWKNPEMLILIEDDEFIELYYRGCAIQIPFEYHGYPEEIRCRSLLTVDETIAVFMDVLGRYGVTVQSLQESCASLFYFDESFDPIKAIGRDWNQERIERMKEQEESPW